MRFLNRLRKRMQMVWWISGATGASLTERRYNAELRERMALKITTEKYVQCYLLGQIAQVQSLLSTSFPFCTKQKGKDVEGD